MSSNQQMLELITKWFMRIVLGISGFILSMFLYNLQDSVKSLKIDVQTILIEQATQKERIRNIDNKLDRLEDTMYPVNTVQNNKK